MSSNYVYRLHSVGKLNSQSMLLCIAVHGSKVPLCLSMVLPYSPTSSAFLPSLFLMSPALLMFLFTFVVSKIIEAPRNMTVNEVSFPILSYGTVLHVEFENKIINSKMSSVVIYSCLLYEVTSSVMSMI